MAHYRFWRTCECGDEFLTSGKKFKCRNCLAKAKKVYIRPTWTPKKCAMCSNMIPHNRSDGVTRYNLKKTCSEKCRIEYHKKHYKYWRQYE